MRHLLDTHAFLWWISDDPSLSAKAHEVISNSGNEIYLSAVSVWEIAIKSRIGRLDIPADLGGFIDRHVRANAFMPLPVTLAHSAKIRTLPNHHRDPFDQMLVAQSLVEGMPIISMDQRIGSYEVEVVW